MLKLRRMTVRRRDPVEVVQKRLKLTRLALGHTIARKYAEDAGLTETSYNNYEKHSRIGLDGALALCETYNLSLDWIYFGDTAGLPGSVLGKLQQYEAEGDKPKRNAPPSAKRRRGPFTKTT